MITVAYFKGMLGQKFKSDVDASNLKRTNFNRYISTRILSIIRCVFFVYQCNYLKTIEDKRSFYQLG